MGTFCIFFGVFILAVFIGLGIFAAYEIAGNSLYMTLFGLNDASLVFVIVIGICFFIGLLICIGLVMNGLNYNKLCAIEKRRRRHRRQLDNQADVELKKTQI